VGNWNAVLRLGYDSESGLKRNSSQGSDYSNEDGTVDFRRSMVKNHLVKFSEAEALIRNYVMGHFLGDGNDPQVQVTSMKLLELLNTRNSPFAACARLSSKPAEKLTADERKEMDMDACRLITFTEWLMIAY